MIKSKAASVRGLPESERTRGVKGVKRIGEGGEQSRGKDEGKGACERRAWPYGRRPSRRE